MPIWFFQTRRRETPKESTRALRVLTGSGVCHKTPDCGAEAAESDFSRLGRLKPPSGVSPHLLECSRMVFPLRTASLVPLCVLIPSRKDTSRAEFGPTRATAPRLKHRFKGPTSKYSRVPRCEGLRPRRENFAGCNAVPEQRTPWLPHLNVGTGAVQDQVPPCCPLRVPCLVSGPTPH